MNACAPLKNVHNVWSSPRHFTLWFQEDTWEPCLSLHTEAVNQLSQSINTKHETEVTLKGLTNSHRGNGVTGANPSAALWEGIPECGDYQGTFVQTCEACHAFAKVYFIPISSVMYSVYVFWGLIKSGFSMFMHVCRLFNPRVGGGLIISILPCWKFTKYFSYTVQMNARIRWIAIIRYSKHLWWVRFSRLCNKEIVERHNTWLDQLGRFPGLQ